MSFKKVEDWLRSLGLICYAQAFYDNGYEDIDICQKIGDADLDVIGVKNAKDRNDILASLIRLQQGALYFELEPEVVAELPQEREKLEPLLLKTKIKEELDKRAIKLNESPYFNLDGSFGDLKPLAEMISYDLNTIYEDVLDALDQLRRRQLPAEAYALLPEDNPQEYLNVETGLRSRRATSLSKYDNRITKSTSNLHETELQDNKGPVVTNFKGQGKRTGGNKKHAIGFSKIFQSMRRTRSPILVAPTKKKSASDINASEIDLSQEELKKLMMKVKNKELSQQDALDEVNRKMVTRVKSKSFDGDQLGSVFDSSPEPSPKEKEDGQEKKKKEKTRKKKGGKTKKSGHSSTFYYGAIDDEPVADDSQQVQLTNITRSPLRSTSLSSQQGLMDEHGCDDSPELLNHNKDKSSFKDILKRSFRRNGRSPIHGEDSDAFRSNETLNSSTGSTHSSSQDSIVSGELQEGGFHSSAEHPFGHLVPKSLKKPPPIPLREDIIQKSRTKMEDTVPSTDNQHRIVRQASKSVPMPPPRNLPAENVDSANPQRRVNERTRSVTFDDSTVDSHVAEHTKSEKGHTSGVFPHMKPFQGGTGVKQDLHKTGPLPPPRATAWKPSRDPSQPDSLTPPVAPPRLKRNQTRTHSGPLTVESSKTLTEGSAHDEERPKSLPENSRVGNIQARSWDQRPLYLNKDKNQNSLPPDGRHDPLAKSSSLDSDHSQTVLTPNGKPPILGEKPPILGEKPPILGEKPPIIKPKPFLPPRPLSSFTPSVANSAIDGKPLPPPRENGVSNAAVRPRELKHSSSTGRMVLNQISPESEGLAPIRPRPLKDLVKKKLRKESIEIAQKPYTTEEGHWNVPPALLHRYSEELEKPVVDVVAAMDSIRLDVLREKRRPMIPCDVGNVIAETPQRVAASTIDEWLIEVGLPMFSEDFKEVGLTSFDTLRCFSEEDFKNIGVYDQRHLARLLMEIQKLPVA